MKISNADFQGSNDEPSVCVQDFCGSAYMAGWPCQFWADYYPERHVTVFGGDWQDVPNMESETQPTDDELEAWVDKHHGSWWKDYPEEQEA